MSSILANAITLIFLLVILSYYVLLLLPRRRRPIEKRFPSISVIIPAHNEAPYIREAIASVKAARFTGKKEIIVVDDGSSDGTGSILKRVKGIRVLSTKHSGKSASINRALKISTGELIAIVDGDSTITKESLEHMATEVGQRGFGAATCVIKVKNRKRWICMWYHIEQLYNSLMRALLVKVNANITTPGPLSVFRREALDAIGGFSTKGFSEDQDVTIRLIRKGYRIGFAERAAAETNMPYDLKGIWRQRTRFARGIIFILKRHLKVNRTFIDLYTLPIFLFAYIQAVIMGVVQTQQIVSGYLEYFISQGVSFNLYAAKYLLGWFSLYGTANWVTDIASGATPLTAVAIIGLLSTLLTYPLFLLAIIKYDKKFDVWHLIPFLFMFPFWFLLSLLYIICLPEVFRRKQYNIWKKNE